MMVIEKTGECSIYENPMPHLRSRCAKFPGLVELPSGELIAMFEIGEAFESVDSRTYLSRSSDSGKTWQLQGELYNQADAGLDYPYSECLKPTLLKDGSLIAVGYRFDREDPDRPIGNPEGGGLLPGNDVVSFSNDEGRTWSIPKIIEHGYPEVLELSSPCVQLSSGDIVAIGPPFKMWDGSNPTGQFGVLLRSTDKGKSWDATGRFFELTIDGRQISPWESRLCEMQPGRLVVITWAFDIGANKHLPNHITVSHDYGNTWSEPIDTGIMAQASNLMWLENDKLLTIHTHRAGEVGLYVRLVDFSDDRWHCEAEQCLWTKTVAQDTSKDIIGQFAALKFGQASFTRLADGDILATFWCVEDCMYKIKSLRLKLNL